MQNGILISLSFSFPVCQGAQLRNVLLPLLANEAEMDFGEGTADGDNASDAVGAMRSSKYCLVPPGGTLRFSTNLRDVY